MMDAPSFLAGMLTLAAVQWAARRAGDLRDRVADHFRPSPPAPRLYPSMTDPALGMPRRRRRKAR